MEPCIICGVETGYTPETPISARRYYIEGAGQLCKVCWNRIYFADDPEWPPLRKARFARSGHLSP